MSIVKMKKLWLYLILLCIYIFISDIYTILPEWFNIYGENIQRQIISKYNFYCSLLAVFYFPLAYFILLKYGDRKVKIFCKNLQRDKQLRYITFIFLFLCINLIHIISNSMLVKNNMICYGINEWLPISDFHYTTTFVGLIILFIVFQINSTIKKYPDNKQSDNNCFSIDITKGEIPRVKCLNGLYIFILSYISYQIFSLIMVFKLRKKVNVFAKENSEMSKDFCKSVVRQSCLAYCMYIVFIIVFFSAGTIYHIVSYILNMQDEISWFLICICIFLMIFGHILFTYCTGLFFMSGIYKFVDKSLGIIENYTKQTYNANIKYNRVYAFLLGLPYLSYTINNYPKIFKYNYRERIKHLEKNICNLIIFISISFLLLHTIFRNA